tara:strand:- start:3969 stop:4589 length:621 start_codon:yes stop_codon:yes gene_type:complete
MMKFSPRLEQLIQSFQLMPGVGPKSAQRLAFHILERHRDEGIRLASALEQAITHIGLCNNCRNFAEEEICLLCSDTKRGIAKQICIVESPADLLAIESGGHYFGRYFILHGLLSPLDGIEPEDIGLPELEQRLAEEGYQELILATSPTIEGDVTANFIIEIAKRYQVHVSRIAHGVPVGGELEYVDGMTLALSFEGRRTISDSKKS